MPPKIWTVYPFDITDDGHGRRAVIVAADATPALVMEEAKRTDWRKARHLHIACAVPALAFALGLALAELDANGDLPSMTIIVNGTEIKRAGE